MSNLRQAAQQALETFERLGHEDSVFAGEFDGEIAALRAALAEPEQEMTKQKPVAWTDERGFIAYQADSFPRGTTVSPLYAHPPTPRRPLTDEEIVDIYKKWDATPGVSMADFARAIERAHGITGEQT